MEVVPSCSNRKVNIRAFVIFRHVGAATFAHVFIHKKSLQEKELIYKYTCNISLEKSLPVCLY